MSTALQRVRQLQEEIRMREEQLKQLAESPEYQADQSFINDVQEILELHSRTLREAVLLIDPELLGSAPKVKQKRTYAPRKPKDDGRRSDAGLDAPSLMPAPKASPFATFGLEKAPESPQALLEQIEQHAPAKPEAKPAKPAKVAKPAKRKGPHNAARDEKRRIECIKAGTWFMYTNPHTQETEEASGTRTDTLRAWVAEFGKVTVEGWKRPVTLEEAGL